MTRYHEIDHTHCFDQSGEPACGILLSKHTKCCLCGKPNWMKGFKEAFYGEFDKVGYVAVDTTHDTVRDFVTELIGRVQVETKKELLKNILDYMNAEVRDGNEPNELVKSWIRYIGNMAMDLDEALSPPSGGMK